MECFCWYGNDIYRINCNRWPIDKKVYDYVGAAFIEVNPSPDTKLRYSREIAMQGIQTQYSEWDSKTEPHKPVFQKAVAGHLQRQGSEWESQPL